MTGHKRHYINSDGNGGVAIGKGTLAIIGTFMLILQFVISTVTYQVTVKNQVDHLQENLREHNRLQEEWVEAEQDKMDRCCGDNKVLGTKVDRIEKDISEIKSDVKTLAQGG